MESLIKNPQPPLLEEPSIPSHTYDNPQFDQN